jgi:hypothetical protein
MVEMKGFSEVVAGIKKRNQLISLREFEGDKQHLFSLKIFFLRSREK